MRLEITRKSHFAIEAIWALDEFKERVMGAPLADAIGTSTAFLAQIMNPLVHRGWVDSVTGRGGGYLLVAEPASISVLDLIEAIEGPTDDKCALRGGECSSAHSCAIHEAWSKARSVLCEELSSQSITSIPRQGVLK